MTEAQLQPPLPHRGWRIFFWLHIPFFLLTVLLTIVVFLPDTITLSKFLEELKQSLLIDSSRFEMILYNIIFLFMMIGLYGYAYSRKILNAKFWIFVFIISFLTIIYDLYEMRDIFEVEDSSSSPPEIFVWTIGLLIIIPVLFLFFWELQALYRYSFKSAHIWDTSQKDAPLP